MTSHHIGTARCATSAEFKQQQIWGGVYIHRHFSSSTNTVVFADVRILFTLGAIVLAFSYNTIAVWFRAAFIDIAVACVAVGQLYSESQKECSAYKQQNDELARQLSRLMRRISPAAGEQPATAETETESGKGGGRSDDAVVNPDQLLLDFTEEGEEEARRRKRGQGDVDAASLSSRSFVNINSSSSSDVSARGCHDDNHAAAAVSRPQVSGGAFFAGIFSAALVFRLPESLSVSSGAENCCSADTESAS